MAPKFGEHNMEDDAEGNPAAMNLFFPVEHINGCHSDAYGLVVARPRGRGSPASVARALHSPEGGGLSPPRSQWRSAVGAAYAFALFLRVRVPRGL